MAPYFVKLNGFRLLGLNHFAGRANEIKIQKNRQEVLPTNFSTRFSMTLLFLR